MASYNGPVTIFDQVVPAGALSPTVVGDFVLMSTNQLPIFQLMHSGLGAGALGTFENSQDGVNWADGPDVTITQVLPITLLGLPGAAGGITWFRFRVTNGGANGGRVVVMLRWKGEGSE